MAKGKTTEELMMPRSTKVTVDGDVLIVPFDKNENSNANKILAAQLRQTLQKAIKGYKDGDVVMSPKDLCDLAMALKHMSTLSKDIYEASEPITTPKPTADAEVEVEEINFDNVKKTQ